MINTDISNSDKFASLSPKAAVLFCMLIPHFNSYGKLNGGPGFIKDEICPKIPYLTYDNLPELLTEISEKTNVKWFEHNGRRWIHSVNFLGEHQKLPTNKLGQDLLPTYSGPDLEQLQNSFLEVEVRSKKLEVEDRRKPSSSILDELFAEFWSAYPKKVGKGAAEKAFKKIKPDALLSTRIIQAIERQRESKAWKKDGGQFIPHPSTWLNQKRWEDDLEVTGGTRQRNHEAAREFCGE